jgi:hypothetical protein
MADPAWTDIATAVGTIVAAVATCATAAIAAYAAVTWKDTLKNQRADECISAARVGALGRCLSIKEQRNLDMPPVWRAHDELRASWRRFDQAFYATRRYQPNLNKDVSFLVARQLDILGDFLTHNWGSRDTIGWQGGHDVLQSVERALKPIEDL